VRGQYVYDNRIQQPVSTLAEVGINDFGTLGGSKNGTYIYDATRIEVLDNLTWTRANHTLKFGVDFNVSPGKQQRETNYGGVYSFKTLSDYLAALAGDTTKIQRYQQSIAANGTQGQFLLTQRKRIKSDHRVANRLIFHNVYALIGALHRLLWEGIEVRKTRCAM